jgi:hypothetical protein
VFLMSAAFPDSGSASNRPVPVSSDPLKSVFDKGSAGYARADGRRSGLERPEPVEVRVDVAYPARMYDYYLGGKDNFPVDRDAAEKALTAFPNLRTTAAENRAFMRRATAYLTRAGYRQFVDIGTGIPTRPNLHEIAQGIAPDTRVLYVDNDPKVLAYARALLTSSPEGRTAYLAADLREPADILNAPALDETIDLDTPVVLSLVAVTHFLPDDTNPHAIVTTLLDTLPAGSALMLSHITADFDPDPMTNLVATYQNAGIPIQARSHAEITAFFHSLDLIDPGVVSCHRWKPDPDTPTADIPADATVSCYAAVGRLPR